MPRLPLASLFALLLLVPTPSAAVPPRWWLGPTFGLQRYAMTNVNRDIRQIDRALPAAMRELHSGAGVGATLGFDAAPSVAVALRYERLFAHRALSHPAASIDYELPANLFVAELATRPLARGPVRLGAGLAVGMVTSAGTITETFTGTSSGASRLEGGGLAAEAFASAAWHVARGVEILPVLGYRWARIGEIRVGGQVRDNPDGSRYTLDFGGALARVALAFRAR